MLRRLPSLDLQAAVWDILQCLPTHPSILHDIRTMAFLETGQVGPLMGQTYQAVNLRWEQTYISWLLVCGA